jgi:tetratricopeptide (TPR) repeat protein
MEGAGQMLRIGGQPSDALTYFEKAKRLALASGDSRGLAYATKCHSECLCDLGHVASAVDGARLAVETFKHLGLLSGVGYATKALGDILVKRGDWDGAMQSYGEAFKTFSQTHDARGVGYTLSAIGKSLTSNGLLQEGSTCLGKARMFFRKRGLAFGEVQTRDAQGILVQRHGINMLRDASELNSIIAPKEFLGRLTRDALSLSSSTIAAGWALVTPLQ